MCIRDRSETGSGSGPTVSASALPSLDTREVRPGLVLRSKGTQNNPILELSGPALDATFRTRLEAWLATAT